MKKFVKATVAMLGMVSVTTVFVPKAQALDWVLSPDANALAFGVTAVDGLAQVGSADTSQPQGIFGAGFTVNGTTGVSVNFDADLYSWDSYNAPGSGPGGTGYWDAFIVTISKLGFYWDTSPSDPVASAANTWVWGGTNFADGILENYTTAPGSVDNVSLNDGAGLYYVSLVLDTKSLPNTDISHPSWGSFHVSVVPEPETYAMLLAGLGLVGYTARRRKTNTFV